MSQEQWGRRGQWWWRKAGRGSSARPGVFDYDTAVLVAPRMQLAPGASKAWDWEAFKYSATSQFRPSFSLVAGPFVAAPFQFNLQGRHCHISNT